MFDDILHIKANISWFKLDFANKSLLKNSRPKYVQLPYVYFI